MPSDEAYTAVLKALAELGDQWRIYRDTVNRAINLLNHEVLSLAARFDQDDAARRTRQVQIDARMESIIAGQDQIRRWQWIRVGIEVAAVLIVASFVYGMSK